MYPLPTSSSQRVTDHDKQGACRDVTMTEATTGSGEVNKEDHSNKESSSNLNLSNALKPNKNEPEKGEKSGGQDSSQNFTGQFIPTCISPYQQNASAFAL